MGEWHVGTIGPVAITHLGKRYGRYRLPDPQAEADMVCSLRRYGQLAPLVVCRREEVPEILDGFKRLAAARVLGLTTLSVRLLDADERTAKAALYGLNCTGQRPRNWEEAWIVYALVREDGLSQLEVADLLGRHKSWVCRRLALIEKLADEARQDLRLGLLSVTAARSLVRLPAGNQPEVIAAMRRAELTAAELDGIVELMQAAPGRVQEEYILAQPRQALQHAHYESGWTHDPRLSRAGNRLARRLSQLLEGLTRMETWLRHTGRAELSATDRSLLAPTLARLVPAAQGVALLTEDLIGELHHERADPPGDRPPLARGRLDPADGP
jgi:ParB-like chromosome segregation protein Spo0J